MLKCIGPGKPVDWSNKSSRRWQYLVKLKLDLPIGVEKTAADFGKKHSD